MRINPSKRGFSYWRLVLKHSRSSNTCANGLAREILIRYLRITKFTCLDRMESVNFLSALISRLSSVHPCTYHLSDVIYLLRCDHNTVWIGGKRVRVHEKKVHSLKRLHRIAEKTRKLEMEAA